MKSLIIALSLFFALSASAQVKKAVPAKATVASEKLSNEDAAKKNVNDLAAFIPLTDTLKTDLYGLFLTKHQALKDSALSPERKEYIVNIISGKLEATFDAVTFDKIKSNKALFQSLIN